jgi:hypothetical protein
MSFRIYDRAVGLSSAIEKLLTVARHASPHGATRMRAKGTTMLGNLLQLSCEGYGQSDKPHNGCLVLEGIGYMHPYPHTRVLA